MDIIELAAELGKKIAQDKTVNRLKAAQAEYEVNADLQNLISEYNTQRAALAEEYKTNERDEEAIDAINARIEELYNIIINNPVYSEFSAAKEAMDTLLQDVNSEITFQVFGERPCSHDCGSCGGSCSHSH